MKFEDLKGKTQDELQKLFEDHKKEIFNLRFQKASGELEKTHRVAQVRKMIARIKTLLNQKKAA
jgi:large subunit ribosomal protein L29